MPITFLAWHKHFNKSDGDKLVLRAQISTHKKSLKIPKGGNQNPKIEEQTTQWPREKGQKEKQRSTKHTHTLYN